MELPYFAIWKSREIEQKVAGARSCEVLKTKINNPKIGRFAIEYDIINDTATIFDCNYYEYSRVWFGSMNDLKDELKIRQLL